MNLDLTNFLGHLDKDNDNESLFNDVDIDDQEDFLNQTGLPEEELDLPTLKIPESAWKSFLNNFKSANYYNKVIYDFFHSKQNNPFSRDPTIEPNIPNKLIEYFDLLHELPNESGTNKFSPTSLVVMFSVFVQYCKFNSIGDLKILSPIIQSNLKKWK